MAILSSDEISTIFLVGFPVDFKERELNNLFMFATGFEGASIKYPESFSTGILNSEDLETSSNNSLSPDEDQGFYFGCGNKSTIGLKQQIIGFARFQRRQDALAARDHLNGRCIDVERGILLKVEMAKKNLFIAPRKHSITCLAALKDDLPSIDLGDFGELVPPVYKTTRSLSLSIPGNPEPIDICAPLNPAVTLFPKSMQAATPKEVNIPTPRSYSVAGGNIYVLGENPPCNTLYVGNLPLNADEDELRSLFCSCPGFKRLSFKIKANGPMCFVEFEDVTFATVAMDTLYGTLLSTSTKGGIRLSYSKNPLGVRNNQQSSASSSLSGLLPTQISTRRHRKSIFEEEDGLLTPSTNSFSGSPGSPKFDYSSKGQPESLGFRSLTLTPFSPF